MSKEELYEKTMDKLQNTWEANAFLLCERRDSISGIRSSQIAALVMMLIEMGIIKEQVNDNRK